MSVDGWIRFWRIGLAVSIAGSAQFVVCFLLATVFYAGGDIWEPNTIYYSLSRNFVSDLGRTISLSGMNNRTCSLIFNGSLIAFAIALLPWSLFMPMQAWDRPISLRVAAVCGAAGAVALLAMALHPVDLYPARHHLALFGWILMIFFCASIHAWAMLTSRENVVLVLPLLSVAVSLLAIGSAISTFDTAIGSLFNQGGVPVKSVFLEKLFYLTTVIWVLTYSARLLITTDFSDYRDRMTSEDADAYLNQIQYQNPKRR